ncbi:MAG: malto-oligosyltrehalose synthase, partial [Calditrichia bacterium]
EQQVKSWQRINRRLKAKYNGRAVPEPNDEYFLYQILLGTYPFKNSDPVNFKQRVQAYIIKAVREAKVHTAWLQPDADYEKGFLEFTTEILAPEQKFLKTFLPFQQKIAFFGMLNSLSQTVLKMTLPGIPDIYQGCEMWDFSMVDPDNRRPVDYDLRMRRLQEIKQAGDPPPEDFFNYLLRNSGNGQIKLYLIQRLLQARNRYAGLFSKAGYQPLEVEGVYRNNLIAFIRTDEKIQMVVLAPRFFTGLVSMDHYPLGVQTWRETRIEIPGGDWMDMITGRTQEHSAEMKVGKILQLFPTAVLIREI